MEVRDFESKIFFKEKGSGTQEEADLLGDIEIFFYDAKCFRELALKSKEAEDYAERVIVIQ